MEEQLPWCPICGLPVYWLILNGKHFSTFLWPSQAGHAYLVIYCNLIMSFFHCVIFPGLVPESPCQMASSGEAGDDDIDEGRRRQSLSHPHLHVTALRRQIWVAQHFRFLCRSLFRWPLADCSRVYPTDSHRHFRHDCLLPDVLRGMRPCNFRSGYGARIIWQPWHRILR